MAGAGASFAYAALLGDRVRLMRRFESSDPAAVDFLLALNLDLSWLDWSRGVPGFALAVPLYWLGWRFDRLRWPLAALVGLAWAGATCGLWPRPTLPVWLALLAATAVSLALLGLPGLRINRRNGARGGHDDHDASSAAAPARRRRLGTARDVIFLVACWWAGLLAAFLASCFWSRPAPPVTVNDNNGREETAEVYTLLRLDGGGALVADDEGRLRWLPARGVEAIQPHLP